MSKPVTIASAVIALPIKEVELPQERGGFTSFDEKDGTPREIGVPIDDSDSSLAIRVHEYGHLLLRDIQIPLHETTFPDPLLQAVLDVHTNAWLLRHGVDAVAELPLKTVGRSRGPGDWTEGPNRIQAILVAFRSFGLSDPPKLRLEESLRKELFKAQHMAAEAETPEQLIQACQALQNVLGLIVEAERPKPEPVPGDEEGDMPGEEVTTAPSKSGKEEKEDEEKGGGESEDDSEETDEEEGEDSPEEDDSKDESGSEDKEEETPEPIKSEELDRILENLENRAKKREEKAKKEAKTPEPPRAGEKLDYGDPKWMDMVIVPLQLERRLQQTRDYGKASKPSYSNGPLRFPTRALPGVGDGKVFGTVKRGKRGSLLIDASGSMSLSRYDIESILAACPRMQVAMYSGHRHTNVGELRVLAKHGRITDKKGIKPAGSANGIDGPALEWLAKQPGPRYWISDGGVTGVEDTPHPKFSEQCADLTKAHHVKKFGNLRDFLDRKLT